MKAVSAHTVAPVAITPAVRGIRIKDARVAMKRSPKPKLQLDGMAWVLLTAQQRKDYLNGNVS